jgi:hypothetical protein
MKRFLPLLMLTGLLFGQDTTLALNNGRTITGKIISETDSTYIIESEHVLNKIFKRGIIGLMLNLNENQLTTEKEIQKVILAQPKEVGLDGKPNWFVQGGIVSKHSPNIISVVRESQVGANSATYLASGLPLILSVGYRIDNLSMLIGIDPSVEPGVWISYAKDLTVFNPVISFGLGIIIFPFDDISLPILPVLSITYEFGS